MRACLNIRARYVDIYNMQSKKELRFTKSVLINPQLQWGMIKRALVLAGINFLLFWGTVQYAFWAFTSKARELNVEPGHAYFAILESQKHTLNMLFLLAGTLNVLIIVAAGLMFSHRIAGPLYRLKKHLDQMVITGKLSQVTFRKKDYFIDVASSFNRHIHTLDPSTGELESKPKKQA